ncbi:MAG: DUF721 domain-containing protein [Planctomycetota bacterium]
MKPCEFLEDRERTVREPRSLKELLKPVIATARPQVRGAPAAALAELVAVWKKVAGAELSELARVCRFRGGVLELEVGSTPLLAELRGYARPALIQALNAAGLAGIHDVRFRVASKTRQSRETSEE